MKVWLYKGDILPYKVSADERISREAAMAVGETSGSAEHNAPVVSSGGRKADVPGDEIEEPAPLIKEADPEFEKLLEEEEQIERATREQSQTPNFRPGDD